HLAEHRQPVMHEGIDVVDRRLAHAVLGHGTGGLYFRTMADTTAPAQAHAHSPQGTTSRRGPEPPDITEKGARDKDGKPQTSNRRLFMQFLAFGGCTDVPALGARMKAADIPGVVYEDVNDPRGVGVL